MFSARALVFGAAVVLAVAVNSVSSIRCWVCSSDVDRRCGDPFNMTHLAVIDCDRERAQSPYLQSMAVCRKARHRVNNEVITVRSCTWETEDYNGGPCSTNSVSSYAKIEWCETCNHDACNSAVSLSTTLYGLLPLLSAILASQHLSSQ